MKYTKVYDSCYSTMLIGYKFDGGIINRDAHTSWTGNDVLDGYEVEVDGKRVFYASTLKEAKEYVENELAKTVTEEEAEEVIEDKQVETVPMDEEVKAKLFGRMLELEHLAGATTYDGRDYNEQADGAFQMLQILGLGSEYINWAIGK